MKSRQHVLPKGVDASCEISMEDASADACPHPDDHEQNHAAPEGRFHKSTCVVMFHDSFAPPSGWRSSGELACTVDGSRSQSYAPTAGAEDRFAEDGCEDVSE
jgi:hypothetical protein